MKINIVEIKALPNGAHRNIKGTIKTIPVGWAVIPEDVGNPDTLENFPFGEVTAQEIDGVMTVTKWVAGVKPEPTPFPEETASNKTVWDIMAEAYNEGVNEA